MCDECPTVVHACQTDEGEAIWEGVQRCERQLRSSLDGPFAIDLPAFVLFAQSLDLDVDLMVEVATDIEPFILYAWRPQP